MKVSLIRSTMTDGQEDQNLFTLMNEDKFLNLQKDEDFLIKF